jgi:hypothetical protein
MKVVRSFHERSRPFYATQDMSDRRKTSSFVGDMVVPIVDDEKSAAEDRRRRRLSRRQRQLASAGNTAASTFEARDVFLSQFAALLDKCEIALQPMVELNPGMDIQRCGDHSLQVMLGATAAEEVVGGGDRGALLITADAQTNFATARLPLSGTLQYYYEEEQKRWLNADDKHDLEGIIVRDLLRYCRGFPVF